MHVFVKASSTKSLEELSYALVEMQRDSATTTRLKSQVSLTLQRSDKSVPFGMCIRAPISLRAQTIETRSHALRRALHPRRAQHSCDSRTFRLELGRAAAGEGSVRRVR